MQNAYKEILTLSLIYFLSACSPISQTIKEDKVLGEIDGLERIEAGGDALIYRRPGFNLRKFDKFKIDPVRTKLSSKERAEISSYDKRELEKYLRRAVWLELRKGGYEVVNSTGPGVLGIRFTLSDLNSGNPYLNVLQFHPLGASLDVGGITIESEFYDTSNNQVNAIAVVGAEGARKFNISSVNGQWGDVKKIFDEWAKGFRNRLDEKHSNYKKDDLP